MRVIVPCAGASSRFPDMPPKWMLPDHDGIPMVVRAVSGLGFGPENFVFTILKEHDERFGAAKGLDQAFGQPVECVILERPTSSQSETVAETLRRCKLSGSFLVKDSDNFFAIDRAEENYNYLTVASLHDFDHINARNKSYAQIDQDGLVINIREKQVISDLFSVGGYFFQRADEFLAAFDELNAAAAMGAGELYLSEIIAFMMLNGTPFRTKRANGYQDWGTLHEWRAELERRRVFLVSLDGFLFERGSNFFSPLFADVLPNVGAVQAVRKMIDSHQTVVYLSIRSSELEELTKRQLCEVGLPDGPVIFGCGVAQWALVTSGHATMPFQTATAQELASDDTNLEEKLNLLR